MLVSGELESPWCPGTVPAQPPENTGSGPASSNPALALPRRVAQGTLFCLSGRHFLVCKVGLTDNTCSMGVDQA